MRAMEIALDVEETFREEKGAVMCIGIAPRICVIKEGQE